MGRKLTTLLIIGTLSTMFLASHTFGQNQFSNQQQLNLPESGCPMGGMGMLGRGMMQGMKRGMGMRGMMGGMSMHGQGMMGGMGSDMMTARQLVMQREQVKRSVKQLPNGVETLTESDDVNVTAKIQEHVPAMYQRLKANQPIQQGDPLFQELFRYGGKIKSRVTMTPNGVRVIETSTDPYVVKLIKAHAKTVDALVARGMEAMHEMHEIPKH